MSTEELSPKFRKLILHWLSITLAALTIGLMSFVVVKAAMQLGITHPLPVFGFGSEIILIFAWYEAVKNKYPSRVQWVSLGVNFVFLVFLALLLPTREAMELLNASGVKQNLLEVLLN